LLVRVTREDGGHTGGAKVILVAPNAYVKATANAAGHARFLVRPADGWVVASIDGWPPTVAALGSANSDVTVRIASGATVEGRVTVAGGAPPDEIRLYCSALLRRMERPPERIIDRLAGKYEWPPYLRTRVEPDGFFRFQGLPTDCEATLVAPEGDYYSEVGPELEPAIAMRVQVPSSDNEFRLRAYVRVTGRVLRAGGTPVSGALVCVCSQGIDHGGEADTDGRFSVGIKAPSEGLSVSITSPEGYGRRTIDVGAPAAGSLDLGDLTIGSEAFREATLRVLDEEGRPLAGARAVLQGYGSHDERRLLTGQWDRMMDLSRPRPVGPSKSDGLLTLPACGERYRVAVWPFATGEIEVPDQPPPDPLEIRLARMALLDVNCTGEIAHAFLHVTSAEPLFDAFWEPHELHVLSFCSFFDSAAGRLRESLDPFGKSPDSHTDCWRGASSSAHLAMVNPRARVRVELVDALGVPLDRIEVDLERGKECTVTLAAPERLRTVIGTVRDDAGRPVPGVVVRLGAEDACASPRVAGDRTAEDGTFSIPGVGAECAQALVNESGFEPWWRESLRLDRGELDIRLTRGRAVEVVVTGAQNSPVEGAGVWAVWEAEAGMPTLLARREAVEEAGGGGTYLLRGLPASEVTVTVRKGMREAHTRAPATQRSVRIFLPVAPSSGTRWEFVRLGVGQTLK